MREGGTSPPALDDETIRQLAAYITAKKNMRRHRTRRTFFTHLWAYIVSNAALIAWNAYTYFVLDVSRIWSLVSVIFWGLAVLIHYIISLVLFEEWWKSDDRQIANRYYG
ncbi:MAG: 2TM domain-containing protein [SAR202 cluster bacterium]|nr:2TM domain-containing protein [SAR202 cluster bacterium]